MRVAKIAQFADTNKTNPTFFAIARKKCHFTEIMLHKSTKMKSLQNANIVAKSCTLQKIYFHNARTCVKKHSPCNTFVARAMYIYPSLLT